MKFKGGYNVQIKGKPSNKTTKLPDPDLLYLPLFSKRFTFSAFCIHDGNEVVQGQILAEDPDNHSVPLLAPRAGTAKIDPETNHIVLENIQASQEAPKVEFELPDTAKGMGETGEKRCRLLKLGVWQFFSDAFSGDLPDPFGSPQAVIVSAAHLEPFLTSFEALLSEGTAEFEKGLEQIHSLAQAQKFYVILPKIKSNITNKVRDSAKKISGITLIEVPNKYPFDNVKLLARLLKLNPDKGSVWATTTEGVLAVESALTSSKPAVSRVISIAGPAVKSPEHVECIIGYPIDKMVEPYLDTPQIRIINGGVLTGDTVGGNQKGLDIECAGLTLVPEQDKREILSFAHLGFTKHAYSNTFLSLLRPPFKERYTTGVRGEHRPCICCTFCEEVCPSSLMPHLLHKYTEKNRLAEAARFGLNLCIQCGLCAHVCTSKIEIKQILLEGQEKLLQEI